LSFIGIFLNRFKRNEKGATAIEYGLLVALIAVALLLSLQQVAISMTDMFKRVDDTVSSTIANGESGS
jgi:pilus assembly protein Flp/PilA